MSIGESLEHWKPTWKQLWLGLIGLIVACYLLAALLWGLNFGWRWATAGPKGELAAREQILSGANRITAYNHFFNLCASIQTNEAQLDGFFNEFALYEAGTDDYARVATNITGVQAARAGGINQYNADANKDYTIGQFRDLDLPYQLAASAYPEGGKTQCVGG